MFILRLYHSGFVNCVYGDFSILIKFIGVNKLHDGADTDVCMQVKNADTDVYRYQMQVLMHACMVLGWLQAH
jgi:hypothetical protein